MMKKNSIIESVKGTDNDTRQQNNAHTIACDGVHIQWNLSITTT